jgi:hypothetical protein
VIRCRFKSTSIDDYRPVHFPPKHPWWCSGEGEDYAVLIAYANDEAEILRNWPEAYDLDSESCDEYTFTDRFPRPKWFK